MRVPGNEVGNIVISKVLFKIDFFGNSTESSLNFIEVRQFPQVALFMLRPNARRICCKMLLYPHDHAASWMLDGMLAQNVSDSQSKNNPETSL